MGELDFKVTVNDASKTTYLDDDGKEIVPQKETTKNKKEVIANVDQT